MGTDLWRNAAGQAILPTPPKYSKSYKRYVTVLLLTVYVFNQADRAIFGFLMEPIKRDLGFTDTQLGFAAGPALVFFYAILGIPIARWADRNNRANIMSVAVGLWSVIVVLTATAGSFVQLTLARVGVGIGEAGFSAIAQSLIADYHSPPERTRALSVFMLGIPLGLALSNLLGGWVNETYGWRAAFVVAGVPGILLAVMLKWTVRDPLRGDAAHARVSISQQPTLRSIATMLWRNRSLRHLAIAMTIMNVVVATIHTWMPAFFMRTHSIGTRELGIWIGLITGIGAALGAWASANLSSRSRTLDERWQIRVLSACSALTVPLLIGALVFPSARGALVLLFPAYFLQFFLLGPTWSLLQGMCASGSRATLGAIVIFAQTLLAGAIGVQLVGIVSDLFSSRFGSGNSLRAALMLTSVVALWAALHLWIAGRSIREDSNREIEAAAVR